MATLDDLLALLPDNTTGEIDAADLRTIVTALWNKSSIGGEVDQLGNLIAGPPGWTSSRDDVGVVTITHNLGTERYAVAITPMVKALDGYTAMLTETTPTSFTYQLYSANAGGLHDTYVNFIVAVDP